MNARPVNMCTVCDRDFGGLTAFDRHQDVDYKRSPAVICRDPEELGMHQDKHGRWRMDGGGYWTGPQDGTAVQPQAGV